MPLFEYLCPHCGHKFEVLSKRRTDTRKCTHCGRKAKRQVSRSSFVLKGRWAKEGY